MFANDTNNEKEPIRPTKPFHSFLASRCSKAAAQQLKARTALRPQCGKVWTKHDNITGSNFQEVEFYEMKHWIFFGNLPKHLLGHA